MLVIMRLATFCKSSDILLESIYFFIDIDKYQVLIYPIILTYKKLFYIYFYSPANSNIVLTFPFLLRNTIFSIIKIIKT